MEMRINMFKFWGTGELYHGHLLSGVIDLFQCRNQAVNMTYKSGKDSELYYTGLGLSLHWNRKGNCLGKMCESRQFVHKAKRTRAVAVPGESWKRKHSQTHQKHRAVHLGK